MTQTNAFVMYFIIRIFDIEPIEMIRPKGNAKSNVAPNK